MVDLRIETLRPVISTAGAVVEGEARFRLEHVRLASARTGSVEPHIVDGLREHRVHFDEQLASYSAIPNVLVAKNSVPEK